MFESAAQLVLGPITGDRLRALSARRPVAKYQTILAQRLLKDWTVVKIMMMITVAGAAGVTP